MKIVFKLVFSIAISIMFSTTIVLAINPVEETKILRFGENLNFEEVNVGESRTKDLILYNKGNSDLTIEKLRFHEKLNGVYTGGWSGIISANGEQHVAITYTPKDGTLAQGLVYIESDRTNTGDRDRLLTGMGIDEADSVETRILKIGQHLTFSATEIGESSSLVLTLENQGNSDLTIDEIRFHEKLKGAFGGDFSGVIPSNGEENVTITFTPEEGVIYQGLVYIESDRTNSNDRSRLLTGRGVLPVNIAPVAVEDNISIENNGTTFSLNVLSNDIDADGDTLSISTISETTAGGTVTINGTSVDYTPVADFNGTDTFTYTVNDGTVDGNSVTVTILVIIEEPVQRPFITKWKTDNGDSAHEKEVTIGVDLNFDVNFTVDWGDGVIDVDVTDAITHTYLEVGTYNVAITGRFPNPSISNLNQNNLRLLSVEQWGDIEWKSMSRAFKECSNFILNATDKPDLSDVTNMEYMFYKATAFNQPLNEWDTSSITNMQGLFSGASSFNQPINGWNTSNVTNMKTIFYKAILFNQPLNHWNTSDVVNMQSLFYGAKAFNQPLNEWDTSSVTNMQSMFSRASSFNQPLKRWDISNVTSMRTMFYQSNFNQPLREWNTSNVKIMYKMFAYARVFNQNISNWDVSKVTSSIDFAKRSALELSNRPSF